jgi:alpha-1,2-mannosyltransferase
MTAMRATARAWALAGLALLAASAAPLAWHYLGSYPRELWQVDLEVYREGARTLVTGRPLYGLRTEAPQFLPFTYPPFSALVALPLLLAPFLAMGWIWTAVQLLLLWITVGIAFGEFLARFGARGRLVQGVLAAGCVWMLPVAEGIRFGQVNALIVALCLVDVARRDERFLPRGALVGLATAVKLTPGVFWLHWAVARRWRVLLTSVAAAAVATALTALVLPAQTAAYFTDALLDPDRLGPNAGTSNQSLRGTLLRVGPADARLNTLLWLVLVAAVLVLGLAVSARLDRVGQPVAVVAAVGMVAFLVSPVSWVHHLHWGVVVVGALLGDGRSRARVAAALAAAAMLWMRLPWWGVALLAGGEVPRWAGRLVQNSYSVFAVLALAALWWLLLRRRPPENPAAPARPARIASAA